MKNKTSNLPGINPDEVKPVDPKYIKEGGGGGGWIIFIIILLIYLFIVLKFKLS